MIEASIVCDSISQQNHRLTTFLLRYPKFIHGELMTHRVFSRNASSSRAVPVSKNIEEVRSDALRAAPVYWGAEQKGMASGAELDDSVGSYLGLNGDRVTARKRAQEMWKTAALKAAASADYMVELGIHKSIVNRVLEPFLHINVLVTATEYMNFFGLRLDKAAQPEMRALADTMWMLYQNNKPKPLQPGWWHLPFMDVPEYEGYAISAHPKYIKVSVARCARLSYASFETGKRSTVEEDLALYERLVGGKDGQALHASPAEHQATPDAIFVGAESFHRQWKYPKEHGNFVGWRQFRKMLPGESLAPLPEGYHV